MPLGEQDLSTFRLVDAVNSIEVLSLLGRTLTLRANLDMDRSCRVRRGATSTIDVRRLSLKNIPSLNSMQVGVARSLFLIGGRLEE